MKLVTMATGNQCLAWHFDGHVSHEQMDKCNTVVADHTAWGKPLICPACGREFVAVQGVNYDEGRGLRDYYDEINERNK